MTDEEFAIEILPRVSRTFALSIEALGEPLRSTVRVCYLLCRVVDTIEDDPTLEAGQRARLFAEFARVIGDDDSSSGPLEADLREVGAGDDRGLCRNAGAPIRLFRALPRPLAGAARPHVLEMARGMAAYAARWRGPGELTVLADVADLEAYCYYVAGTVGTLLTDVFMATDSSLDQEVRDGLIRRAVAFGLGLQLTNIVKDVAADRARGWCFLPASICDAHGISPLDLGDPGRSDRAMAVVRDVVELARRNLASALEYTLIVPPSHRDVRLFIMVPLVLALGSLTLVATSPRVLASAQVKVPRSFVLEVLKQAREVVSDDEGIRTLCARASALEL
jgi:farnesyl-diphosphate farnesyltransferase